MDAATATTFECQHSICGSCAEAMGCVEAAVEVGDAQKRAAISPDDQSATFELALPAGPAMLRTRLKRADGKEHGAYFAEVQRIE